MKKDLGCNPTGILQVIERMTFRVIIHDKTTHRDHQYPRENDKTGKKEKLELRHGIPRQGTKRLIEIDKNQVKYSRE